jgi:hypothetical protein
MQRCENCGRPLLKSDERCFHCQTPVPGREQTAAPATASADDAAAIDLRSAARHTLALAVVALVTLILLNAMGAGHRANTAAVTREPPPSGWRQVVPPEGGFRLWLPESWDLYLSSSPTWPAPGRGMMVPLPQLFSQYEPSQSEDRILLLSRRQLDAGAVPMQAIVQLHPALSQYDLNLLESIPWSLGGKALDASSSANVIARPSGDPALYHESVYRSADTDTLIQCISIIVQAPSGLYALTVSADVDTFLEQEHDLWQIVESFAVPTTQSVP